MGAAGKVLPPKRVATAWWECLLGNCVGRGQVASYPVEKMITCKECLERLFPDDPRIPTGRYHHSGCDYFCSKPQYYRDLETQQPLEQVIVHRHSNMSKQESDLLQQAFLRTSYLLKKLNEKQSLSKRNNVF